MDLFIPNNDQDTIRTAMEKQWQSDIDAIKLRRIVPDWKGEPKPLSKDKAALLEYLYENGFIEWPKTPGPDRIKVAKILGYVERDDGMIAVTNAKAVIDACYRDKLIETSLYRGKEVYQMTQDGEYALEEWQIDRELGFL
jgi:hypothetical protein